MGIIIGVVVLAVIAGVVVVAMKGKSSGTSGETTASSAEAIARVAPQTTSKPAPTLSIPKPEPEPAPRPSSFVDDPVPFTKPSASLPRLGLEPSGASVASEAPAAAAPAAVDAPVDEHDHNEHDHHEHDHHEHDDDPGFDRFGAPGQRAKVADDDLLSKPLWEVAGGAAADGDAAQLDDDPDPVVVDEVAEVEVPAEAAVDEVAEVEPERFDPAALVIEEPELEPHDVAPDVVDESYAPYEDAEDAEDADDIVDLEAEQAMDAVDVTVDAATDDERAASDAPQRDETPAAAGSDPVDHVLNALINRAKERQVGIAQVAAELVEQADLEDKEVDEVLADLLGVAESEGADAVDRPELTLFSDAVPQRPGQLTDFARLPSTEKKRADPRAVPAGGAPGGAQARRARCGRAGRRGRRGRRRRAGGCSELAARPGGLAGQDPQRRDDDRDLPGRSASPRRADPHVQRTLQVTRSAVGQVSSRAARRRRARTAPG
ncbi:MAG: hypothetical protein R2699_12340 [Acidimicrobiales bacterium]